MIYSSWRRWLNGKPPAAARGRRVRTRRRGSLLLEPLEDRRLPATLTWTGLGLGPLGPDPNWSNSSNWAPSQVPTTGDDLIFPAGASQTSNNDDLGVVAFASLTFTGASYVIDPDPFITPGTDVILLGAGSSVTATAAGTNTLNLPLTFTATPTFDVGSGDDLILGGNIDGVGGVTKVGPGTLHYLMTNASLAPANTYTGTTTVNAGSLGLGATDGGSIPLGVVSISGPLVVGDGAGGTNADVVRLVASNQIADASGVSVDSSGLFDLNGNSDTISALTMTGGNVTTGIGVLTPTAGVTANAGTSTATISGLLGFSTLTATISVADGTPAQDLVVAADMRFGGNVPQITKDGAGTLVYAGNNATATTNVNAGSLLVTGTQPGDMTVATGAALGGTGTVGIVSTAGTLNPGVGGPGILNSGNVTFGGTSSFAVELNGTTVGTGFDQLAVTGTVALGGATLSPTLGFTSAVGDTFTILDNDGTDPITGTFAGLPEGANFFIGAQRFQISYVGGTGNDVVLTAVQADTTTTVTSGPNPSVFGESVTFTATVVPVPPAIGVPTGSVTFFDGMMSLGSQPLNASGQATLPAASLAVGAHSITAVYSGDVNFNTSTSAPLTQTVNQASTATSLTSALNPSGLGQGVTFTATVAPVAPGAGVPTGSVDFVDGTTVLANAPLSAVGQATFSTSTLSVRSHSVTAVYSGDGSFTTSTSALLTQVVTQAASTTVLTATPNPSTFGQVATLTVTVAPVAPATGVPTGSVTLLDGSTALGSAPLNASGQATLPTSTLAVGSHSITAVYGGDGNFTTSTSAPLTQVVNQAASATALTATFNPSVFGQAVGFTATVTPLAPGAGVPTGNVSFLDGTTVLGTVPLTASGQATLPTSALAVGSHAVTAVYSGDGNFAGSSSGPLTQVVNRAITTTALTSDANPSIFRQVVTFTAMVTPMAPGAGVPTGSVNFFDGTTNLLASEPLNASGQAMLSILNLTAGSHPITAVYNGDGNFFISTSASLTQIVGRAASSITVTSSLNPASPNQAITFTAIVSPPGPSGQNVPTGTITFFDGTTSLGTVQTVQTSPVRGSVSSTTGFLTVTLSPGSHNITARYDGDSNFFTSTSAVLTQTVVGAPCDPNSTFVEALYQSVLHRAADPQGLNFWLQQLAAGESRTAVAAGFWISLEHRTQQVNEFYLTLLHRPAEPAGLAHWVNALLTGTPESEVVILFLTSPEYTLTHGTNQSYVLGLYDDLFQRQIPTNLSAAEVAFWQFQLDAGLKSRAGVALDFLGSGEAYQTAIAQYYFEFLARNPNEAERLFWQAQILSGNQTPVSFASAFLGSDEYLALAISRCS